VSEAPSWRRWAETWYLAYALLGAAVAGLVPIVLPMATQRRSGTADVGLVMAAFSLGGLSAPLWGKLADRFRLHRLLLASGLLVAGLGLAAFPLARGALGFTGLALVSSVGVAAAATVANLFVVEAHPRSEWDERIGVLQAFYGGGQVAGLLLAGVLTGTDMRVALPLTGALAAAGAVPGWLATRTPAVPSESRPALLHPVRHGEWAPSAPQRLYHHADLESLRLAGTALASPFGVFLTLWFLSFGGAAACFALYPVWMRQSFGVPPSVSSLAFAVAAGLGLLLYSPAGSWSERFGPALVLRSALASRLLAFLLLLGLALLPGQGVLRGAAALGAFAVVVLAWSPLSVVGTALAARLSPVGEGASLGLFNSATAVAGVAGAAAGGLVAGAWGLGGLAALSAAGVASGILLTFAASEKKGVVE
jgi:DHA1 family tetracycline resistance protein-like MFS transporter